MGGEGGRLGGPAVRLGRAAGDGDDNGNGNGNGGAGSDDSDDDDAAAADEEGYVAQCADQVPALV